MSNISPNNFFTFVTKEISHSAFWAWCLNSLNDKNPNSRLDAPQAIAKAFLDEIGFSLYQPLCVNTEYSIIRGSRIDIIACDNQGNVLGIENKIKAKASADQIKRYKTAIDHAAGKIPWPDRKERDCSNAQVILISAGFDAPVAWYDANFPINDYLGPSKLLEIVGSGRSQGHALTADYYEWLQSTIEYRRALIAGTYPGDDAKVFEESIGHADSQWAYLERLTRGIDGIIRFGTSHGRPWTHFSLFDDDKINQPDSIFIRLDSEKKGPYLAFRQYGVSKSKKLDETDSKAKHNRFHKYKECLQTALKKTGDCESNWLEGGIRESYKEATFGRIYLCNRSRREWVEKKLKTLISIFCAEIQASCNNTRVSQPNYKKMESVRRAFYEEID